jgi:hypothetical protein
MQNSQNLLVRSVGKMANFSFLTYINIVADSYNEAIDVFDYQTKGLQTYVAEIEEID